MILFKDSVRIKVFSPVIRDILVGLERFCRYHSDICPSQLVVTSINDSTHKEGSKHYINQAIDVRSKNFESWNKRKFKDLLTQYLNLDAPNRYTVLLESENMDNEHFHIQLAKGTMYHDKDSDGTESVQRDALVG